ncbi:DUF4079 domain-containing protein [Oscillatoria acuminata]|uniref:DUF4079 domain-containing protein n=1 Tax=Oscillatoria acuminata PCC 6304 TaxID=56110 RepID=K9TII7_9CYAN|nr:DUF4079 domain-containing protein [Oscillatoria acuminata]AFY82667.1 hypothetical protein Oscil6304_3078 [Oscillatoria acuminata PCC 6304]
MIDLSEALEPIASQFRSLGLPEPIVHWGHPLMMGIVIFVMGSYVGWSGWRGRVPADKDAAIKGRSDHRKLAPWMFLFMALGYTGGVLSLVMQRQPILESPHFWTGSILLVLLALNGTLSLGFQGDRLTLRAAHAYIGTVALGLMLLHALLGLKLGLSISI